MRTVLRADSGFFRPRILSWCERSGVACSVGLAQNKGLGKIAELGMAEAGAAFRRTDGKQRRFEECSYATLTT